MEKYFVSTHQFNVILCHFSIHWERKNSVIHSLSIVLNVCKCFFWRAARERQIIETKNETEKKIYKLKTKLRIYLCILYVLRKMGIAPCYPYETLAFISRDTSSVQFFFLCRCKRQNRQCFLHNFYGDFFLSHCRTLFLYIFFSRLWSDDIRPVCTFHHSFVCYEE